MKLRDTVRRAGRSLRQAKARTLLTSLAIGVGAFTITLSLAAGAGGKQYAADIVNTNTNPRELYVQPKQEQQGDPSAPKEYSEAPTINYGGGFSLKTFQQKDINAMKELGNVQSVTPVYNVSAKYVTRPGEKKYTVGVEAYLGTVKQEYAAGAGPKGQADGVILTDAYAKALGFASPQKAVGQVVDVVIATPLGETKTYPLTITGVTKKSALSALTGSGGLQVQNDKVADMYKFANTGTPLENSFIAATVLAKDESNVKTLKQQLTDKGFDAQTAEDLMGFIFQFINVLQGILLGFGALAVLTSIFGIVNTQYISVLERTQQIGLMKALGMRRRDVGRLFKIEAAWIGFLGGAIGSGFAAFVSVIGNPVISEALSLGKTKLLIVEPLSVVIVIVGLMLVSVVAGILPARKASKLDPIEALRTE